MKKDRVAMITGGSRGLGKALASKLCGLGWTVIIDGRDFQVLSDAAREIGAGGGRLVSIPGDVADSGHRERLTRAARDEGRLDLLVNNASTLGPTPLPLLAHYPIRHLEEVFLVNTIAPLALTQSVIELLSPGGKIINITSDAGVEAYETWGGYGASKAAFEHLSAVLAAENPELRVYWVDPGDMRTQMQQDAFPGEDISDRPPAEESVPGLVSLIEGDFPSGRYQARQIPVTSS